MKVTVVVRVEGRIVTCNSGKMRILKDEWGFRSVRSRHSWRAEPMYEGLMGTLSELRPKAREHGLR